MLDIRQGKFYEEERTLRSPIRANFLRFRLPIKQKKDEITHKIRNGQVEKTETRRNTKLLKAEQ